MQKAVEERMDRSISLATLDRARKGAWPASSNVITPHLTTSDERRADTNVSIGLHPKRTDRMQTNEDGSP
jgi:hypothetical protein